MQTCPSSISSLYNVAKRATLSSTAALISQRQCVRHASHQRQIAVLGGGITGLATAYFIRQQSPHVGVTLYEKSDTLGGWLKSTRVPTSNGSVLFEAGPRSLRPQQNGALAVKLVHDLGLLDQTIITSRKAAAASHRYLYYPDHLVRMPHPSFGMFSNLQTILSEPIFRGVARGMYRDIFEGARDPKIQDESIADFFTRRFDRRIVDNILSGVIHGIYAGDVDQLSAKSIFPRQWHYDEDPASVILGSVQSASTGMLWRASQMTFIKDMQAEARKLNLEPTDDLATCSVFTFKEGLGALSDALARRLWDDDGVQIRTSTAVEGIQHMNEHKSVRIQHVVEGEAQKSDMFDRVVSTVSPAVLSQCLSAVDNSRLPDMPSVNVMTVNLFYPTTERIPPGPTPDQQGFGYLIPRGVSFEQNPERALGVVFDHAYSPLLQSDGSQPKIVQDELPSGGTKLTVMLGGHWWSDWPAMPDEEEGLAMAKSIVARHLGITSEPELWRVNLQRDCIPQYTIGHEDRLRDIHRVLQDRYKGTVRVAGNWTTGVGVNDCLRSAWEVCRSLLDDKANTGLEQVGNDPWVRVKVVAGG